MSKRLTPTAEYGTVIAGRFGTGEENSELGREFAHLLNQYLTQHGREDDPVNVLLSLAHSGVIECHDELIGDINGVDDIDTFVHYSYFHVVEDWQEGIEWYWDPTDPNQNKKSYDHCFEEVVTTISEVAGVGHDAAWFQPEDIALDSLYSEIGVELVVEHLMMSGHMLRRTKDDGTLIREVEFKLFEEPQEDFLEEFGHLRPTRKFMNLNTSQRYVLGQMYMEMKDEVITTWGASKHVTFKHHTIRNMMPKFREHWLEYIGRRPPTNEKGYKFKEAPVIGEEKEIIV